MRPERRRVKLLFSIIHSTTAPEQSLLTRRTQHSNTHCRYGWGWWCPHCVTVGVGSIRHGSNNYSARNFKRTWLKFQYFLWTQDVAGQIGWEMIGKLRSFDILFHVCWRTAESSWVFCVRTNYRRKFNSKLLTIWRVEKQMKSREMK